jgi:TPR repeat protein
MAENGIGAFSSPHIDTALRYYEGCSDLSPAGSACFGWCLQTGFGIPIDFTVAAEFLRKAADSDDVDGMNSFGCCLERGEGVDANIDWAVSYYRKAAKQSHPDGMYNFGRCLEYGKGIEQNIFRAAKYYRLSAEQKNASAQNSFGICLERGIGVHKNMLLAAQYYHQAAQQGHPDGANNFGFCLEHGRGVQPNIKMASEYYKFAADQGHCEAKLNHDRCLRLLGQWKSSDRSSEVISHPQPVERLSHIFQDFLNNPEPLDEDGRRLLNSFEQLKASMEIPVISDSSTIEWIPDEIVNGDSSVVKLSIDSKSNLTVVKQSVKPDCVELIRREVSILKTLKHPLILKCCGHIFNTPDHNSAIVTEFAGNGSLTYHLSPSKCNLSGANRITRIIVGIALAMRFIHSKNVIHRDLKPDKILLDWDWNVRIADFGHSTSPVERKNFCEIRDWPSVDFRYLAPECYDRQCYEESDVFSFGLILYELLVGKPVFPKELEKKCIAWKVCINNLRPEIPKFVLPSAKKMITDCWAIDPGERPSFEEIVNRLVEMKFRLMPKVNSVKLADFVKKIEEMEKTKDVIPQ